MKYTGKYRTMDSKKYGKVNILEYRSEDGVPYCECDKCGKDIKRRMFVVQDAQTDIEILYLGAECIKKFA